MDRFNRGGLTSYRDGDHWVISDRSGKKIRASEARREWNGPVVHESEYDPRHPQDFVKVPADKQSVPHARPRPADTFMGPKKTTIAATHAAGETTITVASSGDFSAADNIYVMLDDGDAFRTAVQSVPDSTSLALTTALPGTTSSGQDVVNESVVTVSDVE